MKTAGGMKALDDRELARLAGAGDGRAFDELMGRYAPRLYAFAFRLCGRREDAEDMVQDTFMAALRGLAGFRWKASLLSWLFSIGAHRCQRMRRLKSGEPRAKQSLQAMQEQGLSLPADPAQRDILDQLGTRQAGERLAAEIVRLPPDLKKVLVLRDVQGLDAAATAAILGISVAAVKSRLHRARMELKGRLAP